MTEKNLYPSDQADKVLVRMPDGMRDRLKEAAKANNRTMNAEIVARLEAAENNGASSAGQKNNAMLLKMLASFVLLQQKHPEVMHPMRDTIARMCQTISEADKDADILAASKESFLAYVSFLTEEVDKVTELLGPGWAGASKKTKSSNSS